MSTDKLTLNSSFLSKRVKLLPCQREMIHFNYKLGTSINSLSKIFKVSKRLVQFELFPERKLKNIQDRENRGGWRQYYDKENNRKAIKGHRDYKDEINKQFELI